ncbi:MAG: DUF4912 domain-containing protein [Planctomycetes bacterium]|nr:DUF4912 domain-containing protein [Planctomycetota bacterium]
MTTAALKLRSRKNLADMAKQNGIAGWHSMTKTELVQALVRKARAKRATAPSGAGKRDAEMARLGARVGKKPIKNGQKSAATNGQTPDSIARSRDLSTSGARKGRTGRTNYLDAVPAEAQWIRLHWDLTRDTIRRAESRLGVDWHAAVPALRLFVVAVDDVNNVTESTVKDVRIDAGINTWFVHVPADARSYRVHIGYKTANGQFYALAKSNVCSMPVLNGNLGAEMAERAASAGDGAEFVDSGDNQSQNRLGRPLGFSTLSHFGPAASEQREKGEFAFKLETELVVHGTSSPGSVLTVQGEPIDIRDDGSFTIRVNQPEGRQVVTFTAISPRGNERRMIVLGVERNTKELERQYFDGGHPEG